MWRARLTRLLPEMPFGVDTYWLDMLKQAGAQRLVQIDAEKRRARCQ